MIWEEKEHEWEQKLSLINQQEAEYTYMLKIKN